MEDGWRWWGSEGASGEYFKVVDSFGRVFIRFLVSFGFETPGNKSPMPEGFKVKKNHPLSKKITKHFHWYNAPAISFETPRSQRGFISFLIYFEFETPGDETLMPEGFLIEIDLSLLLKRHNHPHCYNAPGYLI